MWFDCSSKQLKSFGISLRRCLNLSKLKVFSLLITEVGTLMSLGAKGSCKFFHNPNKGKRTSQYCGNDLDDTGWGGGYVIYLLDILRCSKQACKYGCKCMYPHYQVHSSELSIKYCKGEQIFKYIKSTSASTVIFGSHFLSVCTL